MRCSTEPQSLPTAIRRQPVHRGFRFAISGIQAREHRCNDGRPGNRGLASQAPLLGRDPRVTRGAQHAAWARASRLLPINEEPRPRGPRFLVHRPRSPARRLSGFPSSNGGCLGRVSAVWRTYPERHRDHSPTRWIGGQSSWLTIAVMMRASVTRPTSMAPNHCRSRIGVIDSLNPHRVFGILRHQPLSSRSRPPRWSCVFLDNPWEAPPCHSPIYNWRHSSHLPRFSRC